MLHSRDVEEGRSSSIMNPSSSPETPGSVSRRHFLHGASFALGATAALSAQTEMPAAETKVSSGERVTSLIAPSAQDPSGLPPVAPPDKQPPSLVIPKPVKKLGWAVVGLGELALEEILPAFGECKHAKLTALVSGHPEKAKQLAEVHGIQDTSIYNYQNFDRLQSDPNVDVVYIVLPNSLHAEFTIRALQAGKHVLCEKPMAVSVAECESMIAAAHKADRKLAIGYRLHHEPLNIAVMQMCQQKKFGKIKQFKASNCQTTEAPNIRLTGALGGGPLGDLGIYCINAARYTLGEEPIEAVGLQTALDPKSRFREVPEAVSFTLRYPSGVVAICECSFGTAKSSTYQVLCEKGVIQMNPAYYYSGLKLWTESAKEGIPTRTEINIPQINQFASEMDDFSQCIKENKTSRTPGEMGLSDLRIILAVMESARRGGEPVKIA